MTDDKYELIQLFNKYITPLPQRKFRANRLGTLLTSSQKQFGEEKRSLPVDSNQGEKHESDRRIYTVTMQKPTVRNTAPIKLKRPPPTTAPVSAGELARVVMSPIRYLQTDEEEASKRIKLDAATT